MFNWLRRRTQLAGIKAATEDMDRFILGLKGSSKDDLAALVAMSTHHRNGMLSATGHDLFNPLVLLAVKPDTAGIVRELIGKLQNQGRTPEAAGWMIWLHTLRATNLPEVRLKGREMWAELARGHPNVLQAQANLRLLGIDLDTRDYWTIPKGLEPLD